LVDKDWFRDNDWSTRVRVAARVGDEAQRRVVSASDWGRVE
jgi:hypothetical protein